MFKAFLVLAYLFTSNAFGSHTCQQYFQTVKSAARAPLTEYTAVTAWALTHSRFSSLQAVKDTVRNLVVRNLITPKSFKEFNKALKQFRIKDPSLALRFKFIFNAIETAADYTNRADLNKEQKTLIKKLAYVAIWATYDPNLSIGKLGSRNHFGHSIQNIFYDRVFQAEINEVFHQMLNHLRSVDFKGKTLLERFTREPI